MHAVLTELVVVMAASVAAAMLLRRLRLPPVVGFILAGILVGPGGLGLVADRHTIAAVAEVGVVLLLFTVGLKLRLGDLWRLRTTVLGVGGAQVLVTGTAAFLVAFALGRPAAEAAVWGMVVALSSTALVLWLLEGSGETTSSLGRGLVGVLLLQDLAVVPIMLALPLLAGGHGTAGEIAGSLGRAVLVIVLTVAGARLVFPALAARVVAAGSRELFTLTTVLVAVGTALVFGHFGLSMALGAFLAGMVVSESEFVSRMVDDLAPLRDVFNSVFFVSLGMLVEPSVWLTRPLATVGLAAAVVGGKTLLAAVAAWPVTRSPRLAAAIGLGLAQIGEFSVIVATEAGRLGVLGDDAGAMFLAVAVPTMVATPGLMALARRVGRATAAVPTAVELADHLVVVGFGVNGRNVHQALAPLAVPHVVVDLNPHTVRELEQAGVPAVFGNAEQPAVLEAAGVPRARVVIVAIPDAASTRQVVAACRGLAPAATIIARTRYVREVEPLESLGADQVIPEEFETSLALLARVLELYGAPPAAIREEKAALRERHYGALRAAPGSAEPNALERLAGSLRVVELGVAAGSRADGCTLRELDLRQATGATVLAVVRGAGIDANPSPDRRLAAGDHLVLTTDADGESLVRRLVSPPPA